MRTPVIIGLTLASLAAVSLPMAPASAASAPASVPKWSMVPMSKDNGGDGFIDGDGGVPSAGALTMNPSVTFVGAGNGVAQPNERLIGGNLSWYLDQAGYPVRLDACASTGDRYTWTIVGPAGTSTTTSERALKKKTCGTTVLLPEGPHTLTLRVTTGKKADSKAVKAAVSNILMVALGDSYASGEGNPRNVESWLTEGGLLSRFTPYWDDDPCNRSTRGALVGLRRKPLSPSSGHRPRRQSPSSTSHAAEPPCQRASLAHSPQWVSPRVRSSRCARSSVTARSTS
jgi:hypothetical protein